MNKTFTLRLYNPTKAIPGVVLALVAVITLAVATGNYAPHRDLALVSGGAVFLAGGFVAYRWLRHWATYEAEVLVSTARIRYRANGREQDIPLAELATYRHESFNGRQVLCLKLRDGRKVKLVANDVFGKAGDFGGLAEAVERVATSFRPTDAAPIVREPSFFERPVSTIMLVVFSGMYALVLWNIFHDGKPLRGSLLTSLGLYVTYLAAWLAASRRRNQKS